MRTAILRRFGVNLRRLRLDRELTQEALAERAGCHRNYIGGLERGERNPTLTKVLSICEALGCEVQDLTGAPQKARS
ncbi:MAG: helix-turn-helix transcriptional regulator [bacterium]|nr:helix-turn-helix transcriptional regulator [bacterium]